MSDISVNYQYIDDFERFFPIFPRNDFHLQKSCLDGPTPEISTIYRRYFTKFLTLVVSNKENNDVRFCRSSFKTSRLLLFRDIFLNTIVDVYLMVIVRLRFYCFILRSISSP